MSTFLSNLASRAVGQSAQHPTRLLRPIIPSMFASAALDTTTDALMEIRVKETHGPADSRQAKKVPTNFSQAQEPAGAERTKKNEVISTSSLNSARVKDRSIEAGVGGVAGAIAEELDPVRQHESKIVVDQRSLTDSKDYLQSDRRRILPHLTVEPIVERGRGREDQLGEMTSHYQADESLGRLSLPLAKSMAAGKPGLEEAHSGGAIDGEASLRDPAETFEPFGAPIHTARLSSNRPMQEQQVASVPLQNDDRRGAASSITGGSLTSASRANGRARLDSSPMGAQKEAVSGSASSASSNPTGLRERVIQDVIAQNRLLIPAGLRSKSAPQQHESSAGQRIVEVHIGRVEVRAPAQSSTKAATRESSKLPSLDDYLRGRSGQGRA